MPNYRRVILVAVIMLWPFSVSAGMDYQCLKVCKDAGKATNFCMEDCRTPEPIASKPSSEEGLEAGSGENKQFEAPKRADALLVAPPQPDTLDIKKDYACLQTCLQAHLQYSYCDKRCTQLPTGATSTGATSSGIVKSPSGR